MVVFALTLVRHGETGHNKDNVIQGQLDVPLSSVGLEQANRLGVHLQHQKYTHVYASDLIRAKLTAESILEKNHACQISIVEDTRLRERKFGVVEGKSFKYLKEAASKSGQSVPHIVPVGAETVQQVHSRAVSFFKELCSVVCSIDGNQSNTESNKEESVIGNGTCTLSCSTARSKRKRDDSCDSSRSRFYSSSKLSESSSKIHPSSSLARYSNSDYLNSNSTQLSMVAPTFSDEAIRSHLTPCQCDTEDSDCPNVSLSPLVSHQNARSDYRNDVDSSSDVASDSASVTDNATSSITLSEACTSNTECDSFLDKSSVLISSTNMNNIDHISNVGSSTNDGTLERSTTVGLVVKADVSSTTGPSMLASADEAQGHHAANTTLADSTHTEEPASSPLENKVDTSTPQTKELNCVDNGTRGMSTLLSKSNLDNHYHAIADSQLLLADASNKSLLASSAFRVDVPSPNVSISNFTISTSHHFLLDRQSLLDKCDGNSLTSSERERRTSICSSNDENEGSMEPAANVLVVSHGGLIKEMIRYFVEELGCSLPGGKKQALRISPNTGISKFTISLNDPSDDRPKVICHQIHDKHHLMDLPGRLDFGAPDSTAL